MLLPEGGELLTLGEERRDQLVGFRVGAGAAVDGAQGGDVLAGAPGLVLDRVQGAAALRALGKPDCVLFDVKNVLPREAVDDRL